MTDDVIKTGVDQLISFLQGQDKVLLPDAASALGLDVETLQSWVDFLVEEGIIGIEYKFTKPYIYLNDEDTDRPRVVERESVGWEEYKKAFLQKAQSKKIPEKKALELWKSHVFQIIDKQQAFFYDEARKRGMNDIDNMWKDYKTTTLARI